jgi:hypothetical protein
MAKEGSPVKLIIKNFNRVKWHKSCVAWIMGNHPQSLKVLMCDSVLVLWRKGKRIREIEKIIEI